MGIFNALGGSTIASEYPASEQCQSEPSIEPGQIRLVECENAPLRAFHAALLAHANVVLYDRALSGVVAEALPIGAYAEPLAAITAGSVIAPRARLFAADGWSVLLLVEQCSGWRRHLRSVMRELDGSGGDTSPLLAIGTIAANRYRPIRYRQQRGVPEPIDIAVIAAELRSDELLSLTFAPSGAPSGPRGPVQGQVFTANGLAG